MTTATRPVRRSVAERVALGKEERRHAPRGTLATLTPPHDRDVPALVAAEEEGRVPELLPIRHERMLASVLAFYRGTAGLMAGDLAAGPSSALEVQLCGDAHLSNYGVYAAPDRQLVFDLNDFDQTLPGPFEWDVKRLAASFEVAARGCGLAPAARRAIALEVVGGYRRSMRDLAERTNLEVWYARLEATTIASMLHELRETSTGRVFSEAARRARSRDSLRALTRLTEVVDGKRRIVSQPPLVVPIGELVPAEIDRVELEQTIVSLVRAYRRTLALDRRYLLEAYAYVDLARKVVGVGSVGTRCWVMLLAGRDESDALVLQVKEAGRSVLEPFLGESRFANCGQRVVEGQRLMQAASDPFLGWVRNRAGLDGRERDFYVRQLWDWKGSIEVEQADAELLTHYARICAWTLARAHARSGDRVAIASYLGKADVFDRAIADFASAYADVAESDFRELARARDAGRLAFARTPA
jgi:uncharacterized protein (DUF2252 family)